MSGRGAPPPLVGAADHSGSKKSAMRARLSGEDRGGFNCYRCRAFVRWGQAHECEAAWIPIPKGGDR